MATDPLTHSPWPACLSASPPLSLHPRWPPAVPGDEPGIEFIQVDAPGAVRVEVGHECLQLQLAHGNVVLLEPPVQLVARHLAAAVLIHQGELPLHLSVAQGALAASTVDGPTLGLQLLVEFLHFEARVDARYDSRDADQAQYGTCDGRQWVWELYESKRCYKKVKHTTADASLCESEPLLQPVPDAQKCGPSRHLDSDDE
mmetsp:Transcript_22456/g.55360  ORF Transcript_22456/g.55360 Transcript_22456/m.55360 type:complete len:201 (-) Transcript_22456:313-915(-)